MKKKYTLILDDEFVEYCKLNDVDYVEKLAKETFNRGFSLLKYGETPKGNSKTKEIIKEVIKEVMVPVEVIKEVIVEKIVDRIVEVPTEVIREVIKEVPVEIIREIPVEIKGDIQTITKEVIREVPVEVIKEVIVEKLIDDYDCKNMIITLTEANRKLKEELDNITNSLNNLSRAKFMKSSDLGSLYDE
jgi:hypothetical protein